MSFLPEDIKYSFMNNVISVIFPNLDYTEKDLLNTYLIKLINYIAIKFNFPKDNAYYNQFTQNNYQDAKGLLLLLLPYISETVKPRSSINSLNDLYIAKESSTKYVYTNLQYNRCIPKDNLTYSELYFDKNHLVENYLQLRNTIHHISNKLYVNWIDIIPCIDFTKLDVYKNTIKGYKNRKIIIENPYNDSEEYIDIYNGLSVQDIYEVITNKLYYDIKEVKWLIFDYSNANNKLETFGYILNSFIPLDEMINEVKYNNLIKEKQDLFNYIWDNIKKNIGNSNKKLWAVLKILVYYFNKYYYNNKDILFKRFEIKEEIEPDETLSRSKKDDELLLETLNTISSFDVYNFIFDQLRIFETTWYCKKIKSFFKNDTNYFSENILLHKDAIPLTFKNIYNYAKLFCANIDLKTRDLIFYPRYWASLDDNIRNSILERFYDKDNKDFWFNIMGYIKITYSLNKGSINIKNINNTIYSLIKNNIIDIIFEALSFSGHLSIFIPNPSITNNDNLSKDELAKNREIKNLIDEKVINPNSEEYENSYYFLTNKKYYKSLIKYNQYKNNKDNYAEISFLRAIGSPYTNMGGWYNTYAMNWISQIGFFHKFINNRVIYVTGGTGVGKSTQIPKLLLYGLSVIDYNNNGKIVCSQPRIPPTEDNAKTISYQMGVPIKDYNAEYNKDIKNNNYYVTYSHKKDTHNYVPTNIPTLQLSIVTDGKLLETIKRYPIMKYINSKGEYTSSNICDIVIVDEAHEHNKNMDFILTIMRSAAFYNNSIRLVIISATMDDDEYTYRRYYRSINDNMKYPLNLDIKKMKLDRINVDRRIHISPPNNPTRFTITEYYEPDLTPEEIVQKILDTTKDGDIILFQPGKEEIKKSRDLLNKIMPFNVIALPFYSELDEKKAEIIKGMNDERKYKIQIPRSVPFERSTDKDNTVKKGTYNRVVIIATNIAEASITINSLKYVVDTGTEKTSKYDYTLNRSVIELGPISESSRLQRKGRVGRVAPGVVYYNYTKGMMEKNSKKYGISTQTISDTLFSVLKDPNDKLLIGETCDFGTCEPIKGFMDVYKNLYTIMDVPYNYYGVESLNYKNKLKINLYQKGYDIKTITDNDGSFYIVHPNELDFKRNIMGTIIDKEDNIIPAIDFDKYKNTIVSYKMESFWDFMVDNDLLYFRDDDHPIKTEYGILVQELQSKFIDYTFEEVITLIYANKYNKLAEVFFIIILLKNTDYLISGLTHSYMFINFFNNYKNTTDDGSDISSVHNICKKIMDFIKYELKIDKSLSVNNDLQILKNNFLNDRKSEIDFRIYEKVQKLFFENKLSMNSNLNDNEIRYLLADISKAVIKISVDKKNENKLNEWCENNYLNFNVIWRSINFFFNNINDLVNNFKNKKELYDKIQVPILNEFDKNRINYSFIKGFIGNISKKIDGSQHFINFLRPDIKAICSISAVRFKIIGQKRLIIKPNSLVDSNYNDYIVYLGLNGIKNIFTIVIPVKNIMVLKVLCPKIFMIDNVNTRFDYTYLTFNSVIDRNLYNTMIKMTNDFKTICNYNM